MPVEQMLMVVIPGFVAEGRMRYPYPFVEVVPGFFEYLRQPGAPAVGAADAFEQFGIAAGDPATDCWGTGEQEHAAVIAADQVQSREPDLEHRAADCGLQVGADLLPVRAVGGAGGGEL